MNKKSICIAVLLMAVVTLAAAVPVVAKGGGSAGKTAATVLYLSGTPREMGLQYGSMAKDAIAENIEQFWTSVEEMGLSKDAMVAEALSDSTMLSDAELDGLKGMSKTSGIPYGELVAFNLHGDDLEQYACTCFIAAGSGSDDGRAISSKNRDLNNMQVLMFVEPDDGFRYIGMMSAGALGVSQGINEKGVAIGHTWMPVPEYYDQGHSPFIVNQMVMERCSDVSEAVALIDEVPKSQGATFVISDPYVAAFVETVPSVINTPDAVWEIMTDGTGVHTNHYVMEPFYSWVIEDGFGYMWTVSFARYDRGLELLEENPVLDAPKVMEFTRDLEDWGCGSPTEVIEAHPEVPDECWSNGWPGFSICNARTVSASVFQCDDEYPEELSTMWMAINNPAYSPYVPLHNALLSEMELAGQMCEPYIDGTAWAASSQLKGVADWGELIPVFEAWEAEKRPAVAAAEDMARSLLSSGDGAGACLLLTEFDGALAQEAYDLMLSLQDYEPVVVLAASTRVTMA